MVPKLAICTVVYNNYTILADFFRSLEQQTNQDFRLFISDLSTPKQVVRTTLPMTLHQISNLGYAHGINIAIDSAIKSDCRQLCIVNDDIIFSETFVQHVTAAIQEHPGGLIGGKIYYASGYEYYKNRYAPADLGRVLWYAGGRIDWDHATTHHRGVDEVDHGQYNEPETTDFITGCLMCYDKTVVEKVGKWDESYFLYYEDTDFCERAKLKGLSLYYDPDIVIWHKNSQSTAGSGSKLHVKYQTRNRFKFGLKYAPLRTRLHLIKNKILGRS